MPPPAFSRIALAAALVEYDNDSDDPTVVKRSAQDSAIFSHLRPSGPVPKPQSVLEYDDLPEPRRTRNFLRVALPQDADVGLLNPTEHHEPPTRRSRETRRSLDVLREQGEEYFERHQNGEDDEENSDGVSSIENVDLASWGLDSFIPEKSRGPKDKAKPRQRSGPARIRPASEHLDNLPNPHSPQEMDHESPMLNPIPERSSAARSHSLFGDAGMRGLFLDERIDQSTFPLSGRRRTIAMPDEFGDMTSAPPILLPLRPGSAVDPSTIPFPDSRPASALGYLKPEEENVFDVPLPPPDRVSRFDPKATAQSRPLSGSSWVSTEELRAARQQSNVSIGSRGEMQDAAAENRDPSVMTGLADVGNRNSQMPPDSVADMRRLSRMQLMRPKVLIMPSPLREVKNNPNPQGAELKRRGGFEDSTDDRPLPVNFRASAAPGVQPGVRPLSMVGGGAGGLNEMLLPNNPRMSLSTTQLMFRNNLLVGGQRDVSYQDIDNHLARATEEGEKIEVYEEDPYFVENEFLELQRPTGKLLGKSLMDTLEARKAEIRGKKRVFTGDNRRTMMERQTLRKSTLIDPESFNMPQIAIVDGEGRPIKQDGGDGPARRPTAGDRPAGAPLLEFGVANADPSTAGTRPGMKARGSVFGVDTLWEREVSKLEKFKRAEAEAVAEEKRLEEEARKLNSKRKKGKEKRKGQFSPGDENQPPTTSMRESQAPALPDISRVSTSGRPRPRPTRDDISDEDEMAEFGTGGTVPQERRRESTATLGVKGWFAGGSDEEDEASRRDPDSRARTPNPPAALGARNPISPRASGVPRLAPVADYDEDEDEDEPLVNKMHQIRASVFTPRAPPPEDDPDEDAPLASIKAKVQLNAGSAHGSPAHNLSPKPSLSPRNGQNNGNGDDDDDGEDNVPLGLRASTLFPSNPKLSPDHPQGQTGAIGEEDEDEKPLGLRFSMAPLSAEQQQQQHYSAMLQQQQQQQQMYMHQMARNSMASFSGMGMFGAMGVNPAGAAFMAPQMTGGTLPMGMALPMAMPVVVPTAVPPNPGDAAKISRVDDWRKGVESAVPKSA